MNDVTPDKKSPKRNKLVIIGLIILIIFIAWLAVQIVKFAPSAFTSLASLADGIDQYEDGLGEDTDEPLLVSTDVASTTVGKPVVISWKKDEREGTYTFLHDCKDGVSVDILDDEGLRSLECSTRYNVGDTDTLTIIVNSNNERSVEVPYTISFLRMNDQEPVRYGDDTITIINEGVKVAVVVEEDDGVVLGETDSADFEEDRTDTPPPTPTPRPKPVVTPTPRYTYSYPVSDPNGRVDLKATFKSTGTISGRTFSAGTIEQEDEGAIQFEIQNIGTKTSGSWSYRVILPNGNTFTSPLQAPLLPTERVIISIGFPTDNDNSHSFVVTTNTAGDRNSNNDTFRKSVEFKD